MGVKIVLAEDEEHIGYMLKFRLEKEGYEVVWKGDGKAALEAVLAERPDIVILDVMMPGLSGFQVLEKLKLGESTRDIPVVILSGKSQESDIVHGLRSGAIDYITKPFRTGELIARIQRIKPPFPVNGE